METITLFAAYAAICYLAAAYVVLWHWGIDERNIDAIMWHVDEDPISSALWLAGCLILAIPVTLGMLLVAPLWLTGKCLSLIGKAAT